MGKKVGAGRVGSESFAASTSMSTRPCFGGIEPRAALHSSVENEAPEWSFLSSYHRDPLLLSK